MSKKLLVISIIVFVAVIVLGVIIQLQQTGQKDHFEFEKPEQIVKKYFESWGNGNLVEVYSALSDGFKKIEPTAKTFSDFRAYASSQNITTVNILSITEKSNDGKTSVIDYSVEFSVLGVPKSINGTFTLKFRDGDIIKGWKITNPYGTKVDTS